MPMRSTNRTPATAIQPETRADDDRGPRRDESRGRGDRDQRGEDAVQHHRDVGLAQDPPGAREAADRAGRSGDVRRQRDVAEVADAVTGDDAERRAGIESEPAEPEDDRPEHGVRHVVARDRVGTSVAAELPDPRPEQERTRERSERALVVHDRGAGEVLHAFAEQPAAGVPDPVRRDRVDEREDDAEGRIDPELRPLGHRTPHDRQRDPREDDFEEVTAGGGDPGEERVRRLADRKQLVARGEEATRPDEAVAVSEGDPEADGVIDERADGEDQDVLAGDVRRVLHARQTGLEEGEARLHEHHEDRRENDPDRVRRDQ